MTRDAQSAAATLAALDPEALTAAMALAPGVYSRNRLFHLFDGGPARAARRRATTLRGLARQLAGAHDVELVATPKPCGGWHVTYRIARLRLTRSLELTDLERAVVVYLAAPMGPTLLPTKPGDRALVDAALRRLAPSLPAPPLSVAPSAGAASEATQPHPGAAPASHDTPDPELAPMRYPPAHGLPVLQDRPGSDPGEGSF